MLKSPGTASSQFLRGLWAFQTHAVARARRMQRSAADASPVLFFRQWVAHPKKVGAMWPSSRHLARRMVARVPLEGDGLVVELGAGTGTVTRALIERGVAPGRLRVIERAPIFARCLRERFPALNVLEGDAADLAGLLPEGRPIDAIVSSLPLRAMPPEVVADIVRQWRTLVRPGGFVVQFTYVPRGQVAGIEQSFIQCDNQWVLANLPPARVTTFVRLAHDTAAVAE